MKVVIVGQGYVGLPLAQAASQVGHDVIGLDLNQERVRLLNSGSSVVDDISDSALSEMLSMGYRASSDTEVYRDAEAIVICVPTPLSEGKTPNLGAIRGAVSAIAENVGPGALVILESTTYPGTTSTEVIPVLEGAGFKVGVDIFVAYSPERVDPGNLTFGIRNTPKVVGADDPTSLQKASSFYGSFIETVVPVSGTAEAELTKLLENTYRHINIGLVNELAIVCHDLDIDVWEVIRAASTKPFGFQAFYPGPGVGGHCIPIDPNYLSHRVRQVLGRPFRFVELAEDINATMPAYVVSRAQEILNTKKKSLNGSKILLLGVTYKADISDTRESPALPVAQLLTSKGASISYYDPSVSTWDAGIGGGSLKRVADLEAANAQSDLTILLQPLKDVKLERLIDGANSFLDTRGITAHERVHRL